MTIRMRDASGVLRTITRIRMRDASNVLRTISRIRMRDASNVLRTVFSALSVTLDETSVVGTNSGVAFAGSVTTSAVTATPVGGTGPFTYLWETVGTNYGLAPDTSTADDTTFTGIAAEEEGVSQTFRCKVTDANGVIAYSPTVIANIYWYYVP